MGHQGKQVVVVGSGVSGLVAARAVVKEDESARVTLIESSARPGGHDHTVRMPSGELVDMGYMVFNKHSYPNMVNLYKELGVETIEIDMSFAVTVPGIVSWSFQTAPSWALQNLWRPRTGRFKVLTLTSVRACVANEAEAYVELASGVRLNADRIIFACGPDKQAAMRASEKSKTTSTAV